MEVTENYRKVLEKVFFRSFFLQALWNFKGMQNAGFLFAIKPVLDFIYKNDEDKKNAYLRHMDFFNTHPYCASYILGCAAAAEARYSKTRNAADLRDISGVKKILGGPVAAFGDSKIWGTVRPFAALLGTIIFFLFSKNVTFMWAGPVAAFLFYNIIHIGIRWRGIFRGFTQGESAFEGLFTGRGHKSFGYMRIIAIVLVSFLLVKGFMAEASSIWVKLSYPVFFVTLAVFVRSVSATALFYIVVVAGGIFARYCH